MPALPEVPGRPNVGEQPHVFEERTDWWVFCDYNPAGYQNDEPILVDHVVIGADLNLYQRLPSYLASDAFPRLPVGTDDLRRWIAVVPDLGREILWEEGCRPDGPCAEGEEPTVPLYSWQTTFDGRVGNLEFHVRISYVAEHLPPDVETRNYEIFRDFALAIVNSWEQVENQEETR